MNRIEWYKERLNNLESMKLTESKRNVGTQNRIDRQRLFESERNVMQSQLDVLVTIDKAVQRISKALQKIRE